MVMKLRTKITLITIVTVFALFMLAMIINTLIFYNEAKEFRESEIKSSFNFFLEKVNFATLSTESIGFDIARAGELIYKYKNGTDSKKELESYLQSRMVREKSVLGAGFWFEPNSFGEKYMGPYISWDKENLKITWEYSNNKYDYHNQTYYRLAIPQGIDRNSKREKDFYLVPPYMDKIADKEFLFITLSSLMYDSFGKILGITTVDWTLEDLTKLLSQFQITKNSYVTLSEISSSKIIFHPDKNFILQDMKTLTWTKKIDFSKLKTNEIQLFEKIKINNEYYDIYYTLTSSNFLLAAIINTKEAYSIVGGIVMRNFFLSFVTLTLIGIFIFFVVDLSIKPLAKIIFVLRGIANGDVALSERILIKSKDEFGELANSFNQMASTIETQTKEIKEYSENLEDKVKVRTNQLNLSLDEVTKLKKQQDGDYFLTSLLLDPLGKINIPNSENIKIESLLKQKKTFEFKNKIHSIGGDLNVVDEINLKGKYYTVILNGDAMGKSIQGAGGALILGSVFSAIKDRTNSIQTIRDQNPERWLKNTFIELHKTFTSFDGSMLVSIVIALLDNESGVLFLINAEHPKTVLYRDEKASFLEDNFMLHKLGMQVDGSKGNIYIRTYQLKENDSVFIGSDGRDDIQIGETDSGERIINEDEFYFLRKIEEGGGNLEKILSLLTKNAQLTDDFSVIKVQFFGKNLVRISKEDAERIDLKLKQAKEFEIEKKYSESFKIYQSILLIQKNHTIALKELVKISINLKLYEKAIEFADTYIALRPIDTDVVYAKSHVLKKLNRKDESIDLAELTRLRDPKSIKYLSHLIELYIGVNNFRAKKLLEEALDIEPNNLKLLNLKESIKSMDLI